MITRRYKMKNSQISFKSKIVLVTQDYFNKQAKSISSFVDSPWTAKQIVKADAAYTTDICDCSAGGISTLKDITMFHIDPIEEILSEWNEVERTLDNNLADNKDGLQALLFGRSYSQNSQKVFSKFEEYLQNRKIPYSKFENQLQVFAFTKILFTALKQEWNITNKRISQALTENKDLLAKLSKEDLQKKLKEIMSLFIEKVEVSPLDELSYKLDSDF